MKREIAVKACHLYVKNHSIFRLAWLHPGIFIKWLLLNRLIDRSWSAFDFRFYLYLRLNDLKYFEK